MKCFIDKINNIFPFVLTKQMKSHFVGQFVYLCLYVDPPLLSALLSAQDVRQMCVCVGRACVCVRIIKTVPALMQCLLKCVRRFVCS